MTTRPIREALELLVYFKGRSMTTTLEVETTASAYDAALEAVRAIEEMAKSIVEDGSHDYIHAHGLEVESDLLESIAKEAP